MKKKDYAVLLGARIYPRQGKLLRKLSKKLNVSQGQVVREAIDYFAATHLS